jgi:hypothetical protein
LLILVCQAQGQGAGKERAKLNEKAKELKHLPDFEGLECVQLSKVEKKRINVSYKPLQAV